MKVYTKTGDAGLTSLYSGGRVGKDHPRIEAYGTVDELNSLLGLLAAEDLPAGMAEQLAQVQAVLFEIGASLADPEAKLDATPPSWSADPLERWRISPGPCAAAPNVGCSRWTRSPRGSFPTSTDCPMRSSWRRGRSMHARVSQTRSGDEADGGLMRSW
jgi:hypothetical protein